MYLYICQDNLKAGNHCNLLSFRDNKNNFYTPQLSRSHVTEQKDTAKFKKNKTVLILKFVQRQHAVKFA